MNTDKKTNKENVFNVADEKLQTQEVEINSDEFQLIAVRQTSAPRTRDVHEGIKAQASDVHNWNNRIYL